MDIEVRDTRVIASMVGLAFLVVLGVLGWWVTPRAHGEAQVLTPARWHALRLERRAAKETEALYHDARELRAMLERGRPSPVDAMLFAERVYARHRTGTSATGPAREALIEAAEVSARHAAGAATREEALVAANRAFALIEDLRIRTEAPDVRERHSLPYIEVSTR